METKMKFDPKCFNAAKDIFDKIDKECDYRVWAERGANEQNIKIYRKLKSAVRAWSYAITFKWMDTEGNVFVSSEDMDLAREYAEKGHVNFGNGELHKKYLESGNGDYRASINKGSTILDINGITCLSEAQEIYDTYKGIFLTDDNSGSNYSKQVLDGTYIEE